MSKLKVLSLFSGIGAFEKALESLKINFELVNFCEFDIPAVKSYCAIHNVSERLNLGDITKIDLENLPTDVDLITHGSPCQDFSSGGLQKGGDAGSKTRSSLMWNSVEIIRRVKPKYVIWENVPNVLSDKHRHNFDKYIDELSSIGYISYHKILNPIDYNTPQDRNRIFCISILGDVEFNFPNGVKLERYLLDVLDTKNKSMEVSSIVSQHIDFHYENKIIHKKDYPITIITEIRPSRCAIKTNGISPCLVAKMGTGGNNVPIIAEWKRPFTLHEVMRLMGFDDADTDKMLLSGNSKSQLFKQVGNSVSVDVLKAIYNELFKEYINSK